MADRGEVVCAVSSGGCCSHGEDQPFSIEVELSSMHGVQQAFIKVPRRRKLYSSKYIMDNKRISKDKVSPRRTFRSLSRKGQKTRIDDDFDGKALTCQSSILLQIAGFHCRNALLLPAPKNLLDALSSV